MPSRFEPCGLNQTYSMAYGTVPIVHSTGDTVDTVEPWDVTTGKGVGFTFVPFRVASFVAAIEAALEVSADRTGWSRLQQNGMARDDSWQQWAGVDREAYTRAVG